MTRPEAIQTLQQFLSPDPQAGRTQTVDESERFLGRVTKALAVLALEDAKEN